MDKRALAIIIALLVAVPVAFCMAQGESEADFQGAIEKDPVNLGSLTLNVGETKEIDIRNNETAYAGYDSCTMTFAVKNNTGYQDIVTIPTGDSSNPQTVRGVTVDVARQGNTGSEGKFVLSLTGEEIANAADVLIKCTVTVTEDDNTVTDEIFYKVNVTVIGADGILDFDDDDEIKAVSGVNVTSDNVVTATAIYDEKNVSFDTGTVYAYAYGLPAGLNLSVSAEPNGSVTITVTGMTTEVSTDQTNGTSVYVVVRDGDGVEYGGTFHVIVAAEDSNDYTYKITGATPTTVADSYYVINGTSDVELEINTPYNQQFKGKVYVLSHDGGSLSRTPLDIDEYSKNVTTYSIPVDGVGTYVIEILNVDKDSNGDYVQQIVLNVVPQSVGAGAGLIISGN